MSLLPVLICLATIYGEATAQTPCELPQGRWARSVAVVFPNHSVRPGIQAAVKYYTPSLAGADFVIVDETEGAVTFRAYWRE